MKLFEVVPQNFFSVLASKNKDIYLEALMVLHGLFKQAISVELDEYISVLIANMEDELSQMESDEAETIEEQEGSLTCSQKARLIVNKLIDTGWIDKEYKEGSFTQVIALRDYAIKVLNLLEAITKQETREYNSLVFNTYSSLKQAQEESDRMYDALLAAKRNTEQLLDELKSLYHNIRRYHQEINEQASVNDLLHGHFDVYKQMIDRIYHPIKTMDSIHRYRQPIYSLLTNMLGDNELINSMCNRAKTIRAFSDETTIRASIIDDITYIIDSYDSLRGIIDEIDKKHSAYTRNSIEKIEYLLTADRSIKGKLVELLTNYGKANKEQQENVLEQYQKNIKVNRQDFLDAKSLYQKSKRDRKEVGEPLKVTPSDGREVDGELSDVIERVKNSYPLQKIKNYMKGLLVNPTVLTSEISFSNDEEFILVMLATIRANDRDMPYTIEYLSGIVEKNGYKVPNILFSRKEA
jgi:hypothetical protein